MGGGECTFSGQFISNGFLGQTFSKHCSLRKKEPSVHITLARVNRRTLVCSPF